MTTEHDSSGLDSTPALSLGARVRMLRVQHGLSQKELASMMPGVKQQSIDHLEHDRVDRPRYLHELAEVFETSPEWLLHGRGEMSVPRVHSPLDVDLMQEIVLNIEERAAAVGRKMTVDQVHALAKETYTRIRQKQYLDDLLTEFFRPFVKPPAAEKAGKAAKRKTGK